MGCGRCKSHQSVLRRHASGRFGASDIIAALNRLARRARFPRSRRVGLTKFFRQQRAGDGARNLLEQVLTGHLARASPMPSSPKLVERQCWRIIYEIHDRQHFAPIRAAQAVVYRSPRFINPANLARTRGLHQPHPSRRRDQAAQPSSAEAQCMLTWRSAPSPVLNHRQAQKSRNRPPV